MLVLNRKAGERVRIADTVTLTVLSVQGGKVRLGFAAETDVPIHREEVWERIDAERASSDMDSESRTAQRTEINLES